MLIAGGQVLLPELVGPLLHYEQRAWLGLGGQITTMCYPIWDGWGETSELGHHVGHVWTFTASTGNW